MKKWDSRLAKLQKLLRCYRAEKSARFRVERIENAEEHHSETLHGDGG